MEEDGVAIMVELHLKEQEKLLLWGFKGAENEVSDGIVVVFFEFSFLVFYNYCTFFRCTNSYSVRPSNVLRLFL